MKTIKIIALCATAALVLASCAGKTSNEPQPAGISKAEVDSVSFMMGYSFGMSVKQNNFGALDCNQIIKGIKTAIADDMNEPTVEQEEFYRVVNGFIEKRMAAVASENKAKADKFFEDNGKKSGVITTASGLQYQIVREGNGVKPIPGDKVKVNYEGTIATTGEKFDSSYDREEPAEFGLTDVIPGWTEGLQIIDEGGEITLWIPAELAYGERGAGSVIAPNSPLKFRVELLEVIHPEKTENAEETK